MCCTKNKVENVWVCRGVASSGCSDFNSQIAWWRRFDQTCRGIAETKGVMTLLIQLSLYIYRKLWALYFAGSDSVLYIQYELHITCGHRNKHVDTCSVQSHRVLEIVLINRDTRVKLNLLPASDTYSTPADTLTQSTSPNSQPLN